MQRNINRLLGFHRLIELFQDKVSKFANVPFSRNVDTTGSESLRGHALLGHFAYLPVLLIDDIEEFNSVHWVKVRHGYDFRVKEPVTDYTRVVWSLRPYSMDNDVIVQQVDQYIGEQHLTIVKS